MKAGTAILAFVVALGALGGTVWVARYSGGSPWSEQAAPLAAIDMPKVSETGPYPKVSIPDGAFNFGKMKIDDSGEHTFVIGNKGEAPLELWQGPTTCKCTMSSLKNKDGQATDKLFLAPGEEAKLTLSWETSKPEPDFHVASRILTNDPDNLVVSLTIAGQVESLVGIKPDVVWNVGVIPETAPAKISGLLYSRFLDSFEVVDIESTSDRVTAKTEPVGAEVLEQEKVKSAYNINVEVASDVPVGAFNEVVKVRVNAGDQTEESTITLSGHRVGPIRIIPLAGTQWRVDRMLLDLGTFQSAAGKIVKLMVFPTGMPEDGELKIEEIDSEVGFVKFSLQRTENTEDAKTQAYELTVEVPPGNPPTNRISKVCKVVLKINHPTAPALKLNVRFLSL